MPLAKPQDPRIFHLILLTATATVLFAGSRLAAEEAPHPAASVRASLVAAIDTTQSNTKGKEAIETWAARTGMDAIISKGSSGLFYLDPQFELGVGGAGWTLPPAVCAAVAIVDVARARKDAPESLTRSGSLAGDEDPLARFETKFLQAARTFAREDRIGVVLLRGSAGGVQFVGALADITSEVLRSMTANRNALKVWGREGSCSRGIGVIDAQQVLSQAAIAKDAMARVQKSSLPKVEEIQRRQKELRDLEKKITDEAKFLSEDALDRLQKDYMARAADLKRFIDDANREVATDWQKELPPLEKAMLPVVQKLGEEKRLAFIANKNDTQWLYVDDGLDLTREVVTRLNASSPK